MNYKEVNQARIFRLRSTPWHFPLGAAINLQYEQISAVVGCTAGAAGMEQGLILFGHSDGKGPLRALSFQSPQ